MSQAIDDRAPEVLSEARNTAPGGPSPSPTRRLRRFTTDEMGTTSANTMPARIVFCATARPRSGSAALALGTSEDDDGAVTVLIAYD